MSDVGNFHSPGLPSAGIIGQSSPGVFGSLRSHSKTPAPNSHEQADLDLAVLFAQVRRQHENDKARISQPWSIQNGLGPIGGESEEASRRRLETVWDHRSINGNGRTNTACPLAMPNSLPESAPLPPSQIFSDLKIPAQHQQQSHITTNPFMPFQGSPSKATIPLVGDQAAQVAHHLMSLSTIFNPLLVQSEEVERLRREVEMWKGEWANVDRERKRLVTTAATETSPKVIGPMFTAVLIDGDGLICEDRYLQKGFQGGQAAARTLLSALPKFAVLADASPTGATTNGDAVVDVNGQEFKSPRDLGNVIVQVFVNKSGLGQTLVTAGSVASWGVYESFWQGFSAAHELFTVVDVGPGKEASDAKIREHLKLYTKNAQCEMIVLGASHDNGYANVLSSLKTESRLSKLLLLKGYEDLALQLRQYSSRVVSIPNLFRTTKIPTVPPSFSSVVSQSAPLPIRANPKHMVEEISSPSETSDDGDSMEVVQWEAQEPGVPQPRMKASGEWTEAKTKGKKYKAGKGGKAVTTVRDLKPRPCHTYYLSPWGCKSGGECSYAHHYKLNDQQREELAKLAKEMICPYIKNNRCHFTDAECVYGHHCPRLEKCAFGETCRFSLLPNGHGEISRAEKRVKSRELSENA